MIRRDSAAGPQGMPPGNVGQVPSTAPPRCTSTASTRVPSPADSARDLASSATAMAPAPSESLAPAPAPATALPDRAPFPAEWSRSELQPVAARIFPTPNPQIPDSFSGSKPPPLGMDRSATSRQSGSPQLDESLPPLSAYPSIRRCR